LVSPQNTYWRRRICTVALLALTSLEQLLLIMQTLFTFFNKSSHLNEEFNSTESSPWFGVSVVTYIREPLLKGKALYSCPPCTNQFRTAVFDNSNIIYFFNKSSYFYEGFNSTDPSLLIWCLRGYLSGNSYWSGWLSTVDLLALTISEQLLEGTLMRRSTVLSLPPLVGVPCSCPITIGYEWKIFIESVQVVDGGGGDDGDGDDGRHLRSKNFQFGFVSLTSAKCPGVNFIKLLLSVIYKFS
jgi:hypothetical protein